MTKFVGSFDTITAAKKARERFISGLGLLPLALGSTDPGREIEGPMAIVVLGGLVTSTALTLLVLPCWLCTMEDLRKSLLSYKSESSWSRLRMESGFRGEYSSIANWNDAV